MLDSFTISGGKRDSRIEYEELPGVLRGDFSFSVEFKTFASDGIIFYTANINHRDFVTIYMNDGKVRSFKIFQHCGNSYFFRLCSALVQERLLPL